MISKNDSGHVVQRAAREGDGDVVDECKYDDVDIFACREMTGTLAHALSHSHSHSFDTGTNSERQRRGAHGVAVMVRPDGIVTSDGVISATAYGGDSHELALDIGTSSGRGLIEELTRRLKLKE